MEDVAESLSLRCPHCRQGIVTVPKADALRTDLICPACGAEASAPSAIERLAADIGESLKQAIAALDGKADPRPNENPKVGSDP